METANNNRLPVLFGYHASNLGNSHVPLSLCRHWQASGREIQLTVPSADAHLSFPWLQPAMGGLKKGLVYRFGNKNHPRRLTETMFFKAEADTPLVYLWAGLSLEIFKRFKTRGTRIVMERINCHQATARRILKEAHAFWEIGFPNTITDDRIAEENEKLAMADEIFCPSPMVVRSMVENGVPQEKLLATSYGWAPERFPTISQSRTDNPRPVFLFVGTLCVRKGIPLLLKAWQRANIDGELVLCGDIAPEFKEQFPGFPEGKNIRHIAYTRDIARLYSQADLFVFPSLEEGGPMVTYEAMAHGVVPLVTQMGAGAIAQDGVNALVLPDNDADAWAQAMTDMAENQTMRCKIGEQARLHAQNFTWQQVATDRAALLEKRYPYLWNDQTRTGS